MLVSSPITGAGCAVRRCGTISRGRAHLLVRHRPPSRPDDAPQGRGGKFRQEDHAAVGMDEELDPVTRLQPKMLPDGLWDRRLALGRNRGFHGTPLRFVKCNTSAATARQTAALAA